jgi:hypothetical protein
VGASVQAKLSVNPDETEFNNSLWHYVQSSTEQLVFQAVEKLVEWLRKRNNNAELKSIRRSSSSASDEPQAESPKKSAHASPALSPSSTSISVETALDRLREMALVFQAK